MGVSHSSCVLWLHQLLVVFSLSPLCPVYVANLLLLLWALCKSVCSQSNSCRPIKLIPMALRLPFERTQGRVPLPSLSMAPTQRTGIVHRLGPGLGLTPPLNALHLSLPALSSSHAHKHTLQHNTRVFLSWVLENCNRSMQPADPNPTSATKPTVSVSVRQPHNPVYLNTRRVQLDT